MTGDDDASSPARSFTDQLEACGRATGRVAVATAFVRLLSTRPRAFERDEYADGHLTGSAWLVSVDGRRALLTHHRTLGLWVQPGGHADGDHDLRGVALREAVEESGIPGLVVEPTIFDIDRHVIPAHGGVPAHHHYDVRYVVRAIDDERFVVSAESFDLRWMPIEDLVADALVDESVHRMARAWLARQNGGRSTAGW